MVQATSIDEIHPKIPGDKRQRREEDGDDGEDHHEIVRAGADGVEDEGGDVGGAGVHLLEGLDHRDAVVEHVSEVGVRQRCDGDARYRLLPFPEAAYFAVI